jgi:CRP-like cAMP-binding protein
VEGVIATLQRPTTMALMPALARSPQELVATNATTSTCEALGTLIGPAIGGLLLAVSGPGPAMAATALAFGVAALIVVAVEAGRPAELSSGGEGGSRLRDLVAGFSALRDHPSAGLLTALFCAQTFVRGVLTVLLVAVSVELLGLGESGVGFLTAAMGAGGLIGAVLSFALVARRHLALPFSLSLAGWGLPIALIGLAPISILAFAWLALVGIANATLDVAGLSLVQRSVPTRVRGRVFGAFESVTTLTLGLGSLVAPLLVASVGLQGALVAAGALLPLLALLTAPLVRGADAAAVVPHRQLELIRGVPMFSALPMTSLEQIAGGLVEEEHGSGVTVITQGESGDCWYLVIAGEVEVVHDGHRVRTLGTGDGFGEIALLSRRARTATVATTEPTRLYRLPRPVFLEAVTGSPNAVLAGEELMRSRLAELGH